MAKPTSCSKTLTRELQHLRARLAERTTLVALLHDVASAANRAATFEEALQFVLRVVCEQHGWCFGQALRPDPRDPDGLTLVEAYYEHAPGGFEQFRTVTMGDPLRRGQSRRARGPYHSQRPVTMGDPLRRGQSLPGRVLASGQPQWTTDLDDLMTPVRAEAARVLGVQAVLAFPVVIDQEVLAVLEFFSDRAVSPDERTLAAMSSVGMQLGRVVERERAREALRERSRQLEAFFDYRITPFVLLDKEYNFIRVNRAYARSWQREVSEFAGRNRFELHPSDAKAIFDEVVRTKTPSQVFGRPFVFPDQPERGTTCWDWTLAPVLNARARSSSWPCRRST
jgi:PAS domain-containing protein